MEFFSPKRARMREARPSAYQRGYGGKAWAEVRKRVLVRDNFQCRHCGRVCGGKGEAHVDHIVPKRLRDSDDEAGLQVLCAKCHARKTRAELEGSSEP
jgi:5-methylcytosine-specific restriction endonuclease McrA